jgi:hypothetical protein
MHSTELRSKPVSNQGSCFHWGTAAAFIAVRLLWLLLRLQLRLLGGRMQQ